VTVLGAGRDGDPRPAAEAVTRDARKAREPDAGTALERVVHFERLAMASPLRLQVHLPPGASPVAAQAAWQRVSDEFEAVEQALSRWRDDAELTRLNRAAGAAGAVPVSSRVYRALAAAERARRLTGGRFDPRVLGDLERLGYRGVPQGHIAPGGGAGGGARPWLERHPRQRTVWLAEPVDLGGLGKGLALRWAWARLHLPGDHGALLEAGGDLVAGGPASDGQAWRVGIEDPRGAASPLAVVALARGALCTSSVRINRWRTPDGRAVHHLLDPRTGEPGGAGLLAVTVHGPDPAWAEVWSKSLFLAGPAGVGDEARARGLACWWVEADGSLRMTPAARLMTAWTATA
jgi:thiamine biosynthesis lipoprotein